MELAPLARQRFFDDDGQPLVGGKLYSYEAGTTTPKATYVDRNGTPNTNPIITDADGYADVWIDSGYYKFVLKDSLDNVLWTKDQISLPSEAALASAFWRDVVYVTPADSPLTLTQTHNGKLLSVDCTSGAVTINMPEISALSLPYNIGAKLTNSTNAVTFNRAGSDTFEGATSKVLNTANASCQFIADVDKSPDQWAVLDFGVVDFSGYPTVLPVAADFAMIVDTSDSSRNKKVPVSALRNAVYRAANATYSVGADDETIPLYGATFTATLPAIGNAGKRYRFVHRDTALTKIYSIVGTGGNTIGGLSTFKMHTPGEILEVQDPGYVFTVSSANATVGATYTNNGQTFTVTGTISSGTILSCTGTGAPTSSGTLTKASGTGDSTISFSAISGDWLIVGRYTETLPVAWTPTTTGLSATTPSNVSFFWKRRGNMIRCWGSLTCGTLQATPFSISAGPNSIAIDTTFVSLTNVYTSPGSRWGTVQSNGAAGAYAPVISAPSTSTTLLYAGSAVTGATPLSSVTNANTAGAPFVSSSVAHFEWEIPIIDWQP